MVIIINILTISLITSVCPNAKFINIIACEATKCSNLAPLFQFEVSVTASLTSDKRELSIELMVLNQATYPRASMPDYHTHCICLYICMYICMTAGQTTNNSLSHQINKQFHV